MTRSWNGLEVAKAIEMLQHSGSVAEAAGRMGVSPAAMRAGFMRVGVGPPSGYVGGGASVTGPGSSGGAATGSDAFSALVEKEAGRVDRAYLRKLEREVARRNYLTEKLHDSLVGAFAASPIKLSRSTVKSRHVAGRRMITVMLSDIHFGLNVNKREVPGGGYDWQIAARRVARLATEVSGWKTQHREETDLHVVLNGDIVAGLIHLDDSGVRRLTEQIHGATSILVAFVDYLRKHFARIVISGLPGNHCRVTELRQIAQRWDSHSHAIFLAMQMAFRDDSRITFDIPMTGEAVIDLPGGKSVALYTHGDVAPTVANVGKALSLGPMIASLNRLNASGEYRKPIRVFGVGHWHQPFLLQTGIGTILVNGSVIGPDSYARNACAIRGKEGRPCQVMFESVSGYEFGDSRFVQLADADDDDIYDRVIATPNIESWLS